MSNYRFVISAFGDEIDPDLETQLQHLKSLNVHHLELRSAWGTNVVDMTNKQIEQVKSLCNTYSINISGLGSPLGKVSIESPMAGEIAKMHRLVDVCRALEVNAVRIFAYYPTGNPNNALPLAIERIQQLVDIAAEHNITLMLENDEDLVADIPARCHHILNTVGSPHLRMAWDAANFITSGVKNPVTGHFSQLKDDIGVVHVKDKQAADNSRRAAGDGDAQISELLAALAEANYAGYLAVEPHPYILDGMGEVHGKIGMQHAVDALRNLLNDGQLQESNALS
ncbi:MAG: TIM barrel protein [Chloroflexota bacterium]